MIWALLRILIFVGILGLLTLGLSALVDQGGLVIIQLMGWEVAMTPTIAVALLVVGVFALWLVQKLLGLLLAIWRFLNGDETALGRYFSRNRQQRALRLLADSMVALATGDGKAALSAVRKAERNMPEHALTHLIGAQSAQLAGDEKRALHYYKHLLNDKRTSFAALQGLMHKKLALGDEDTARKLAQKAVQVRPKHAGSLAFLLGLQIKAGDFAAAQDSLNKQLRARAISRDIARRRGAVLALAEANVLLDAGDIEAGKTAAIKANKLSVGLVPAAVLAAEMWTLDNNARAAANALRKSWKINPHPDTAAAFAALIPDETPKARLRRFGALLKSRPDDLETRLLHAELLVKCEDFPSARRAIAADVENDPTLRSLSLMAAIEQGEGAEDYVVRGWLNKALEAPRGVQWICGNCHNISASWTAMCQNCDALDSFDWTRAKQNDSENKASDKNTLGFTASLMTEKI